jgi:hypothetical protein
LRREEEVEATGLEEEVEATRLEEDLDEDEGHDSEEEEGYGEGRRGTMRGTTTGWG